MKKDIALGVTFGLCLTFICAWFFISRMMLESRIEQQIFATSREIASLKGALEEMAKHNIKEVKEVREVELRNIPGLEGKISELEEQVTELREKKWHR